MAMHQPSPRIIGPESDDEPSTARQRRGFPASGVVEVQGAIGRPYSAAGAEDEEAVAVQVDGVGNWDGGTGCFLDDPVDPLLRT